MSPWWVRQGKPQTSMIKLCTYHQHSLDMICLGFIPRYSHQVYIGLQKDSTSILPFQCLKGRLLPLGTATVSVNAIFQTLGPTKTATFQWTEFDLALQLITSLILLNWSMGTPPGSHCFVNWSTANRTSYFRHIQLIWGVFNEAHSRVKNYPLPNDG